MSYTWDLKKIYESDEEWRIDANNLKEMCREFDANIDNILNSLSDFLSITKRFILLNELIEKVYCYPRRFIDLDVNDTHHKNMFDEALDIYSKIVKLTNKLSELVISNKDKVLEFLESEDATFYKRYYEIMLNSNGVILDSESAKNIQDIRNSYQTLISSLEYKNLEVDEKETLVNEKNYTTLLLNEDRDIRRQAFELLNEAYLSVGDEIAELYISKLKNDIEASRKLGYKSLEEMKLSSLELPTNLIDNTIRSVREHLNIMHEYILLKKSMLGADDYFLYDSSMPKINDEGGYKDFDEALDIARDCLSFYGDDYLNFFESLKNGSIDEVPRKGKKTIDFTGITYAGIPYICLNYNGKTRGVRNLIHEVGHAVHLLYSKKENDFTYFEFSLFLTEVVAKVNEMIFNNYLLDKGYKDVGVLSVLLNSIFNQIMFTEFEKRIVTILENGGSLDKEAISDIYEELVSKYNGGALSKHKYNRYGWLRISHFIMQEPFYLYQYSIGTSLANVIYKKLANDESYKEKYLKFLGIGNKLNIVDSLKQIDIDLFDERIFDECYSNLEHMLVKMR